MPRYYFNLCTEMSEATDLLGEVCRNDTDALAEALRRASDIMRKRLSSEEPCAAGWIHVEDEGHRPVLTLPLRAAAY